jgi:hypothetical protein
VTRPEPPVATASSPEGGRARIVTVRGFCDRCGLPIRLRTDGTVGRHDDVDVGGGYGSLPRMVECDGTGKPPRRVIGAGLPPRPPVLPSAPMPAGRPPADKDANVAADTTINIRCTSSRKAKLEAKAQRAGFKSLSAWLLHLGEAAPEPTEAPATAPGSTPGR